MSDATQNDAAAEVSDVEAARAANRFDIRRLIGGLFVVYGVILVIIGLAGSSATKHKAAGIDIDLWAGIGMLLFAAFMLGWAFARPTVPNPERAAAS